MHPSHPMPFQPMYIPVPYNMSGFRGYSRKRRYSPDMVSSDPVDDAEAGIPEAEYPHVDVWLQDQTDNMSRNRDKQDYVVYAAALQANGLMRLDDVTRFSRDELCDMAGMNKGTGARLLEWAKLDKDKLNKKHGGRSVLKGGF